MFGKSKRFNTANMARQNESPESDNTNKNLKPGSDDTATSKLAEPKPANPEVPKTKSEPMKKPDIQRTKPVPEIKKNSVASKLPPKSIKPKLESAKYKPEVPKIQIDTKAKSETFKTKPKTCLTVTPRVKPSAVSTRSLADAQSQCGSLRSIKPFLTPKVLKSAIKTPSSLKTPLSCKKNLENKKKTDEKKIVEDILKSQEVEIRNKNVTIAEYGRQIEELNLEIAKLLKQIQTAPENTIEISDGDSIEQAFCSFKLIEELKFVIANLEHQCTRLEDEVSSKQVELSSLEEIICIRDSLCKDLQDKLTSVETCLEENKQRLEMVKGHHALALEANESIRREYKAELEAIKTKLEEEKQNIIAKSKTEQEKIRSKYQKQIDLIKQQMTEEKENMAAELRHQLDVKDVEMKAKLEQIDEATSEKLKLCEIQFEERFRSIQEHWAMQDEQIHQMEKETNDLNYALRAADEQKLKLQQEITSLRKNNENLLREKEGLMHEVNDLKDESKQKFIAFENQINKLTVEVDKAMKEKYKYEMSLSVTRDIVQVLTVRLRESDDDVEHLEGQVQSLTEAKAALEQQLSTLKNSFNNTLHECNNYKDALLNIMNSKSALAKEHNRMMEHSVSLYESLQIVEKEAYRELGSIKNELIEDVEMLRMESKSQIEALRDELDEKRMLCELATDHAGQAAAAAEQARGLVAQAAVEIARLEADNQRLVSQIQDQQSIVVELSLLRQENEELAITVATQTSIIEKMKKDAEQAKDLTKPKSPAVLRKTHKIGKENSPIIISPLRERNH